MANAIADACCVINLHAAGRFLPAMLPALGGGASHVPAEVLAEETYVHRASGTAGKVQRTRDSGPARRSTWHHGPSTPACSDAVRGLG